MDPSINGARTIGCPYGNRYLTLHSKIKPRWIKDLDAKAKTALLKKSRLLYLEFGIGKDYSHRKQQ